MKNIFIKFSALIGYLVYSGVVLVLLLWLLFPSMALKKFLEASATQSSSSLQLSIEELQVNHPLLLTITNTTIYRTNKNDKPLLTIDKISLSPDIVKSLREFAPCFFYNIMTLDGEVEGNAKIVYKSGELQLSAIFSSLHPEKADLSKWVMGRQLSGSIKGKVTYKGNVHQPTAGSIEGSLQVTDGEVTLLKPILAMEQLRFKTVSTTLSGELSELNLQGGKITTELFNGEFAGKIKGIMKVNNSRLFITGELAPQAELFRKGEKDPTVIMVRSLIDNGTLPFSLSGTLRNPGILFQRENPVGNEDEQGGAELQ